MLAKVKSCTLMGLVVYEIEIEVDAMGGLPDWNIVGLPDTAIKESKERVRSALKNSGFNFPPRRIVVNLAPAYIRKEGPSFDLPIALAILAATNQIDVSTLEDRVVVGELGLEGNLRSVDGVLPISLSIAKEEQDLLLPMENALEGAIGGAVCYGFTNLVEVVNFLNNPGEMEPIAAPDLVDFLEANDTLEFDLKYVKGQTGAKRALEIAAAGGHNMLMVGSPGSGKTMLARCLPGILPSVSWQECLEITQIYSISGLLPEDQPLITARPFRSPHHSSSAASIIGGGRIPQPGEVSLSHHGVLFMDELPEYPKNVLEALREPLEEGRVTVSRVAAQISYPAEFILIGAMNPCPCGFYRDQLKDCTCTPHQAQKYRNKVSGPLLDRIDLQVEIPRVEFADLQKEMEEESSAQVRLRVDQARKIQLKRYKKSGYYNNAMMSNRQIKEHCRLNQQSVELLEGAFKRLALSARAHNRILKVARTIADLEGSEQISIHHLAEAIQYRALDRNIWE